MILVAISKLTDKIGAEVTGVDLDRVLGDDAVASQLENALETYGVLVFPRLGLDDTTQVPFCQRLGAVDFSQGQNVPGVAVVSLDKAKSRSADYLRGTFEWHIDGMTLPRDETPQKATLITALAVAETGGETEFASTYNAYDSLSDTDKDRYATLRVRHSTAAIIRRVTPDPTTEQEAAWAAIPTREHPLVWQHRTGRRSLVLGSTAESIVGMEPAEGRALLARLLALSTTPDRVYRHSWSVGDTVLWDNRGVLHRVEPYAVDSPREMIRTTLLGDESVQGMKPMQNAQVQC
jgi:alpha-ketoglutarate-dependent taurine dioxygenase